MDLKQGSNTLIQNTDPKHGNRIQNTCSKKRIQNIKKNNTRVQNGMLYLFIIHVCTQLARYLRDNTGYSRFF